MNWGLSFFPLLRGGCCKTRCERPPALAADAARACPPHEGDIKSREIKKRILPLVGGSRRRRQGVAHSQFCNTLVYGRTFDTRLPCREAARADRKSTRLN